MAEEKEILFNMFKHYMDQGFHHLEQRAATANVILVLTGAAVGLITFDQKLEGTTDKLAAWFLIILGLFGAFWSAKHHERYAYYLERARGYRNKLDKLLPQIDMRTINSLADGKTEEKYGFLYRFRMWYLWVILNALVAVLGVVILFLI